MMIKELLPVCLERDDIVKDLRKNQEHRKMLFEEKYFKHATAETLDARKALADKILNSEINLHAINTPYIFMKRKFGHAIPLIEINPKLFMSQLHLFPIETLEKMSQEIEQLERKREERIRQEEQEKIEKERIQQEREKLENSLSYKVKSFFEKKIIKKGENQ